MIIKKNHSFFSFKIRFFFSNLRSNNVMKLTYLITYLILSVVMNTVIPQNFKIHLNLHLIGFLY